MRNMRTLFRKAVNDLKKHYLLFVIACLLAGFIGAEFPLSLSSLKARMGGEAAEVSKAEKIWDVVTVSGGHPTVLLPLMLDIVTGERTEADTIIEEIILQVNRLNHTGGSALEAGQKVMVIWAKNMSAGQAFVSICSYVFSFSIEGKIWNVLLIVLGLLGYLFIVCFVKDVYCVTMRRAFLEGMVYDNITPNRFLFLVKTRRWLHVGWVLVVKNIFYLLWCLTGVGAFVKRYSYYQVPYILAENPYLTAKEAIGLSRKMMNGHKLDCFFYEACFVPFLVLDMATLGFSGVLFSNPVKVCFFCRYYQDLREKQLEREPEAQVYFCDRYLFEKAGDELRETVYADCYELEKRLTEPFSDYGGVRKKIADLFGVVLLEDKISRAYEEREADTLFYKRITMAKEGKLYPIRLSRQEKDSRRHNIDRLNYDRRYALTNVVWMFFIACMIGWVWEVLLHLVQTGEFVNRGAMYGPWLPIYGCGSMMILLFLKNFRKHPVLFFIAACVLSGTVEYLTSYVMEQMHGVRWWDYTGYFMNLNGRICLEGVMLFGVGGTAFVYVIAPLLDGFLDHISKKKLIIVGSVIAVLFIFDKFYSDAHPHVGTGITAAMEVGENTVDDDR